MVNRRPIDVRFVVIVAVLVFLSNAMWIGLTVVTLKDDGMGMTYASE